MSEFQILDNTKYGKALMLLYRMGGIFRTRPFHKLVLGPAQYRALVDAGLLEPNGKEAQGRGKKKKAEAEQGQSFAAR